VLSELQPAATMASAEQNEVMMNEDEDEIGERGRMRVGLLATVSDESTRMQRITGLLCDGLTTSWS
jgi:hypothetical protein